jgi:hypothetical protein
LKAGMKILVKILAATTLALVSLENSPVGAETLQKLSGTQIRAKFAGMQLTDEMHWRCVYDRDGTLRSFSKGTKKVGSISQPVLHASDGGVEASDITASGGTGRR